MALNYTLDDGDMETQIKWICRQTMAQLISDGSHTASNYPELSGGLVEFQEKFGEMLYRFALDEGTDGVASQGELTVDVNPEEGDTMTIGSVTYTFTGSDGTVKSQGLLTVDTQPLADDTMTIGTKTYTFTADGTASEDGEIDVGEDLADAQALIIAAINGTDEINTAHTQVTAANAWVSDTLIITAITGGEAGDLIATTETFDEDTNIFDAATLGTQTAGADATDETATAHQIVVGEDLAATQLNIYNRINGIGFVQYNPEVKCVRFDSDAAYLIARAEGTDGDSIDTTETFTAATNVFDASTLGTVASGVDQVLNATIVAASNPTSIESWRELREYAATAFTVLDGVINP